MANISGRAAGNGSKPPPNLTPGSNAFLDYLSMLVSYFFGVAPLPPWAAQVWVSSLQKNGVDLTAYGREECRLYEQGLVSWERGGKEDPDSRDEFTPIWILKRIKYGPSSTDWAFSIRIKEVSQIRDKNMIPGGWIEEEEYEENERKYANWRIIRLDDNLYL